MRNMLVWIFVLFIVPALASIGWWMSMERPLSWRSANWSSARILPQPDKEKAAVIHIMSARTGGVKGALSLHTWIVTKAEGAGRYNRYDKVGWGNPVRTNAYAPDARWYSNEPQILKTIRGPVAESLIPKIEKAVADYPFANRGGYRIWPGPNSNSFVAHVLREVPEIGVILPSNAVGRDYIAGNRWFHKSAGGGDYEPRWQGQIESAAQVSPNQSFFTVG